jgi:hypothetical protein
MSQYECYEFQSVDRRLSEDEVRTLRGYSSRAQISPTSFYNEYHFGSFKGNAEEWMAKYFDGFIYNSHWGTRILMLSLPAQVAAKRSIQPYATTEAFSVQEACGRTVLKFLWHDEDCDKWPQTNESLSPLLPLRTELVEGDLRGLYLGWLLGVQSGDCDEDRTEPAVPPNLSRLSLAQQQMVAFLRIDPDLLAAAIEYSPTVTVAARDRQSIQAWVASLDLAEKENTLVEVVMGEAAVVALRMRARFSAAQGIPEPRAAKKARTVGELMARASKLRTQRTTAEARAAEVEQKRREELAAQAHQNHLRSLRGRELEVWQKIEKLIAVKQAKSYDEAVRHLTDLRDLANASPSPNALDFQQRVTKLYQSHATKRTLLERLDRAGVVINSR